MPPGPSLKRKSVDDEANAFRLSEYEICKRRGHQSDGTATTMATITWSHCMWCRSSYRFVENMIETGTPEEA